MRKLYLTCQHGFSVSALIKCMPSLTSLSLTLNVAEDLTGGREDSDSILFPLSAEAALAALAVGPELSGLTSSLRVNVALLLCLLIVQQGPVTLALTECFPLLLAERVDLEHEHSDQGDEHREHGGHDDGGG